MKRIVAIVLFICAVSFGALAQQFAMGIKEPLAQLQTVDQRAYEKVRDDNDRLCALIKVYLTSPLNNELILEVGGLNVQATKKKSDDEIWFFVPAQVKNLEFKCSGYTRIPKFPVSLKEGCDYGITIRVDATSQTVFNALESSNFLKIKIEPADAQIKLGRTENYESGYMPVDSEGWFAEELDYGKWYYQIEHNLYKTYKGQIDLTAQTPVQYVELKPDYSLIEVDSEPEGAVVYLQGNEIGKTPFSSSVKYKRGEYSLRVMKEEYYSEDVTVYLAGDGKVQELNVKLRPQFGNVVIECEDSQAEIWVDKKTKVGVGRWEGTLGSMNTHIIEVRKPGHKSQSVNLKVVEGGTVTKTIASPVPIYGNLKVNTSPKGCQVYVDGVNMGTTPFKQNLLVGEHRIMITRDGYLSAEEKVSIEHNKEFVLSKELRKGVEKVPVAIVTEKNASILCDGVYLGVWSWAGELTEGEHILTATLPDCHASELPVTVSSAAKNEVFNIPSPKRMTGTVEIRGKDGAEVFIYKSGSGTIFKSGFIPYMNESFPTGQYEAVAKKDKYQNSERKSFAVLPDRLVRVDLPQKRVNVTREWSRNLFETTSDYSSFFIDLGLGVDLSADNVAAGANIAFVPGHLGIYGMAMGGDYTQFTGGLVYRVTDSSNTDFQFYAGSGVMNDDIAFDFGARLALGTSLFDCVGVYVGGTYAGGNWGINFGFSLLLILAVAAYM